jgi:hypothetical protein
MKAKIFCPEHGRLSLDKIIIKNGVPACFKCSKALEFGTVRPRLNVNEKKQKTKK